MKKFFSTLIIFCGAMPAFAQQPNVLFNLYSIGDVITDSSSDIYCLEKRRYSKNLSSCKTGSLFYFSKKGVDPAFNSLKFTAVVIKVNDYNQVYKMFLSGGFSGDSSAGTRMEAERDYKIITDFLNNQADLKSFDDFAIMTSYIKGTVWKGQTVSYAVKMFKTRSRVVKKKDIYYIGVEVYQ